MIDMLINKVFCNDSISASDVFLIKYSTAVSEFPINLGAAKEKIRAIMVIKNPKSNFFYILKDTCLGILVLSFLLIIKHDKANQIPLFKI